MPPLPTPRLLWIACLAALAPVLPACEQESARAGRGVLVIAVDAWRAEPLRGQPETSSETGRYRRFLAQALRFRSAWTTAPEMLPAHATLLTGCDPRLGVRPEELYLESSAVRWEWFLSPDVPRLAEAFLAEGWSTAAFVDDVRLSGRSGLDQGFQLFEDPGKALRYRGRFDPYGIDGVARRFHEWLRERDSDEDWFAYLQLADLDRMWGELLPVLGELPPDEARETEPLLPIVDVNAAFFAVPRRRFDGIQRSLGEYQAYYAIACARIEHKLGGLLTLMDKAGWTERTTILLVGSHGFEFGEAGLLLDAGALSDVDLHVPLILLPAKDCGVSGGRELGALVSTMDVAPTLLDLAGVPRLEGMQGESLVPLIEGRVERSRDFAFASSGVVGGWACIGPEHCFEHVSFDAGPLSLGSSYFGIDRPQRESLRAAAGEGIEILHDRVHDPRVGHLGLGIPDEAAAFRLRTAGETWNDLVLRTRLILHDPTGSLHEVAPGEIEGLRRRRMLGRLTRGAGAEPRR